MADVSLMNKDELRDYAKQTFGVNLDMRKSVENLQDYVKKMKPKGAVEPDKPKVVKPQYLKNPATGFFWPWTKILEERGDLVPCDENGNDVS